MPDKLPNNVTKRKSAAYLHKLKKEDPNITSEDIAIREEMPITLVTDMRQFCNEYIKDFSVIKALNRVGSKRLNDIGNNIYNHPFVQLRLFEILNTLEKEAIVSQGMVISQLWREATLGDDEINAPNRIKSLQVLCKALGLFSDFNIQQNNVQQNNLGVMQVPLAQNMDDWEEQSTKQQQQLKGEVHDI